MNYEKRIERIESKIDEIYNEEVISLWKRIHKLENKNEALEKKVQELETKTASDLSQKVVAESEASHEQDCLWLARDKRTDTLYVYEVEPVEQYCETFAGDDEEEKAFRIDFDLFSEVTFENSPQKLVLESSISKTETVEEGYYPTIDDFFYNRDEDNSEKPNLQDAFTELRELLDEAEKDNREKYPDESNMTDILRRMREVIE